jgi:hypothetical protein
MGYERFSAELFSCPFLVVRAVCAAPVGRLARLSTPPALSGGAMSPESTSGILLFNLSPVVRQSRGPSIMRPPRASGKNMSIILIPESWVDGAPVQRLRRGQVDRGGLAGLHGDGRYRVSLDSVVATMRQTAADIVRRRRSAAFAVNLVEC